MSSALVHRGPDDDGAYSDPAAGVSLGVRRLSIIDVPGGHQPISNEDGTVWTVFNGEIYNFPALRERLLADGHELATRSDTEVLPHLYEDYGDDLVHALEGMFAFAIWDSRRQRLLLGRDRFGEKPLFYYDAGGRLVFASELIALTNGLETTPDLDPRAMHAFFVHGYVPGRDAIVQGACQLRPGSVLTWEASSRRVEERTYWRPPAPRATNREPMSELAAEAGRLLQASIRGRLVADVPLGIFLSGGVDSSVIGAIAARESTKPVRSFTVGYDVAGGDEREEARGIAGLIGSEHQDLLLTSADVVTRVPRLLAALDQPLADAALVPLHAVAEFARREITVAIAGEGADELFGGYPRYAWLDRAARVWPRGLDRKLAARGVLQRAPAAGGRARRLADLALPRPIVERHLDWVTGGRRTLRGALYGPALDAERDSRALLEALESMYESGSTCSTAGAFMHLDQLHWLPDDVLVKADRAGMLVSLEVRTPYLQRELAEFAASVDPRTHVRRNGKQILRALLSQLVPGAPQRRKFAFLPPIAQWLRGPLRPIVDHQLAQGALYEEGWFRRDVVADLARGHATAADWSHVLWPLLAAGLWLDRYRGKDPLA